MNSYYDAHNHLQDEWLIPSLPQWTELLPVLGVRGAVVNGTTESDWARVEQLSRCHDWILPSYGLHPWFIGARSPAWRENLERYLDAGGWVGEIGLDRWKKPFDFADQQEIFGVQLQLAAERNLPVTIHCLQAWGALLDQLRAARLPRRGFLIHAYGGPMELVHELVQLGAYFSFNGYFLEPRKTQQREVFQKIPLDRLLVETDAPAMPLPNEKQAYRLPLSAEGLPVNHPANIVAVYENLALLRGLPLAELSAVVEKNFCSLFQSPET